MYEIILINKNNQEFRKVFESPYLLNKFINKVKRGNSLVIKGVVKNWYLYYYNYRYKRKRGGNMYKISRLGRIILPQNLRVKYGINNMDAPIEIIDTDNGILIKPKEDRYVINDSEMTALRKLYIMLKDSGILDDYTEEVLSKITRESESVCENCKNKLFLTNDNTLKCYKCN